MLAAHYCSFLFLWKNIFFYECIACHKTDKEGGFMAYIIENASLLKDTGIEHISLFIKDERIHSLRTSFKRFSHMRLDADGYIMTPSHTLFCPDIPSNTTFHIRKQFFLDSFIKKGCTMFLTYAKVDKEYLLQTSIKEMKKQLLNSPVDYTIGIRIPLHLLTPSLIRKCKKMKIPAIFIEVNEDALMLETLPWGWIREAIFPYNCPLIPIFTAEKPRQQKHAQANWTSILTKEKIPFIERELSTEEPISLKHLCKLGIYPKKVGIYQGGEVSYNFYSKEGLKGHLEAGELFQVQWEHLIITVHKGTVIRAGSEVVFRPGFGEHVIIDTPSFFSLV